MHQTQTRSGGFQRVMSDIADLCELQWQLLSVDGQEAKRRAVRAAIFIGIGGITALSGLMALMLAIGRVIHEQFDLSLGIAYLITAAVALVIAGLSMLIGAKLVGRANASLSESKQEFAENVRWIRSVLLKPSTSPRNQLRREDFAPEPPHYQNGRR
ncbi:MAG: phage holin family protein [Pirellulaceae bacterium]|nr:phage holin family protein [Pirellulaceae bacterium]